MELTENKIVQKCDQNACVVQETVYYHMKMICLVFLIRIQSN